MRIGGRSFGGCLLACVLLLGACGGDDDGGAAPRATVPSSTSTTSTTSSTTTTAPASTFEPLLADPSLTPEEQVEQAYLFSWEIYLDAVERGDPSFLRLAYAGEALEITEREVAELVSAGHRLVGSPELHHVVQVLSESDAVVVDPFIDRARRVDAETQEVVEAASDTQEDFQFNLELRGGSWVVTQVIDYSLAES